MTATVVGTISGCSGINGPQAGSGTFFATLSAPKANAAPILHLAQARATTRKMQTGANSAARFALTFDDGPDPVLTPLVLDALARSRARATFFVVAPQARRCPTLLARMREEGHGVGFHCTEHVRHDAMTAAEIEADVETGLPALVDSVRLWRTPWGIVTPATEGIARKHPGLAGNPAGRNARQGGRRSPVQYHRTDARRGWSRCQTRRLRRDSGPRTTPRLPGTFSRPGARSAARTAPSLARQEPRLSALEEQPGTSPYCVRVLFSWVKSSDRVSGP